MDARLGLSFSGRICLGLLYSLFVNWHGNFNPRDIVLTYYVPHVAVFTLPGRISSTLLHFLLRQDYRVRMYITSAKLTKGTRLLKTCAVISMGNLNEGPSCRSCVAYAAENLI